MEILQALYDSEINFSLSCIWDGGIDVALGDELNGFKEKTSTDTVEEACQWLKETAIKHYPDSLFVKTIALQQNPSSFETCDACNGNCWVEYGMLKCSECLGLGVQLIEGATP